MHIRPIRNGADYDAALSAIDRLMGSAPDTTESDELDILVILVEAYEATRWPIAAPDPISSIEHVMDARGLRQKNLAAVLGSQPRASEVLGRRRPLTLPMIRAPFDKMESPGGPSRARVRQPAGAVGRASRIATRSRYLGTVFGPCSTLGPCRPERPPAGRPSDRGTREIEKINQYNKFKPQTKRTANSMITIYPARKVITMNVRRPEASHVAVRDGWILGAGTLEELTGWGPHEVDDRFVDKVIMPGLVEGHCHSREGTGWDETYVGFYDRTDPDRVVHRGLESIDEVVGRLQEAERALADPDEALLAWGLDPLFFGGRRMVAADLDRVSATRPVLVLHQSGHIINANRELMRRAGISRDTNVMGVMKDAQGEPTGELQGPMLRSMLYRAAGRDRGLVYGDTRGLWRFARSAQIAGVTTATDLANELPEQTVSGQIAVTSDDGYPLRIVPAFIGMSRPAPEGVEWVKSLIPRGNERLRYGLVKLVLDGSIQGFTARLKWPGYYNGAENGLWYIDPDELPNMLGTYHRAGAPGAHPHQRGPGDGGGNRRDREGAEGSPRPGRPLHPPALPDGPRRPLPPHGPARDLREPLREPPLLLGRPALRADDGSGTGGADGRGGERAAARGRVLHPLRRPGDPSRAPLHGVVRGEPDDVGGAGARDAGAGERGGCPPCGYHRGRVHPQARYGDRLDRVREAGRLRDPRRGSPGGRPRRAARHSRVGHRRRRGHLPQLRDRRGLRPRPAEGRAAARARLAARAPGPTGPGRAGPGRAGPWSYTRRFDGHHDQDIEVAPAAVGHARSRHRNQPLNRRTP